MYFTGGAAYSLNIKIRSSISIHQDLLQVWIQLSAAFINAYNLFLVV